MDNVILSKSASIERCVQRVQEEYAAAGDDFSTDYTRQDAALLNLVRACEQSIDPANYVVRLKGLGTPETSRDSFELLQKAKIIPRELGDILKSMVGFRNIAIHNYTKLEMAIVESIIENHLDDFKHFTGILLKDI